MNTTITGLPVLTAPQGADVFPVVNAGTTKQLELAKVREALAVATATEKGLLSAADKAMLDALQISVANLLSKPTVATVASAATIAIPNGADVIVLTGSTNITTIENAVNYKIYVFYYPSGPGIDILGASLSAQASVAMIKTP